MDPEVFALDLGGQEPSTSIADLDAIFATERMDGAPYSSNDSWNLRVDQSLPPSFQNPLSSPTEGILDLPSQYDLDMDEQLFDFSIFDDAVAPIVFPTIEPEANTRSGRYSLNRPNAELASGVGQVQRTLSSEGEVAPSTTVYEEAKRSSEPEQQPLREDHDSATAYIRPKSKRSKISNEAKDKLVAALLLDPYPSKDVKTMLAASTGLTERAVQNWFTNNRSRRDLPGLAKANSANPAVADREEQSATPSVSKSSSRAVSPCSIISAANLERLDRSSPNPRNTSLERYLAEDATKEPPPATILSTAAKGPPASTPINIPIPRRSYSAAGSVGSFGSMGSIRSVDSRGSRQGRRGWISGTGANAGFDFNANYPIYGSNPLYIGNSFNQGTAFKYDNPFNTSFDYREPVSKVLSPDSGFCSGDAEPLSDFSHSAQKVPPQGTEAPPEIIPQVRTKHPYFCTWPNCQKRFRTRFEWMRHEEALHYCPYRWVCCDEQAELEPIKECHICGEKNILLRHIATHHFDYCARKPVEERTFYRQDQLAPHVRRHLVSNGGREPTKTLIDDLLKAWKSDNPAMKSSALRCGFCGALFTSWPERVDHVFDHLQKGVCKSAWWPDRQPMTVIKKHAADSFACPCCDKGFTSFDNAAQEHPQCVAWSCRFLHDFHSTFTTHGDGWERMSICSLCSFAAYGRDEACERRMEGHAETHKLRSCDQDVFTDLAKFVAHLRENHNADWLYESLSGPWKCVQGMVRDKTDAVVCTMQRFEESPFCCTKHPKHVISHLCLDDLEHLS